MCVHQIPRPDVPAPAGFVSVSGLLQRGWINAGVINAVAGAPDATARGEPVWSLDRIRHLELSADFAVLRGRAIDRERRRVQPLLYGEAAA